MTSRFVVRSLLAVLVASGAAVSSSLVQSAYAQTATEHAAIEGRKNPIDSVWSEARAGQPEVADLLKKVTEAAGSGGATPALRDSLKSLEANIAKREADRAVKIGEVEEKLTAKLAEASTPDALSDAVKLAVEMWFVTSDRAAFMTQPRILRLVSEAEKAAAEAEAKGDWFTANELFYRLNLLMDEEGRFREDVRRLGQRLSMIRLYVPERFWKLRNDERVAEGKTALPAYNGLGEDYREKLNGIEKSMVLRAVFAAARQHYDFRTVGLKDSMLHGIAALKTMTTTDDLTVAFPGISDAAARQGMVGYLDDWATRLSNPNTLIANNTLLDFIDDLLATSARTVRISDAALLHEFGNGALTAYGEAGDDFSAIIWPDELARFNRMTEGQFRGVGIHIQLDDERQMIKVVTPLEGTPAQRAGVKSGDLIKKINGQTAEGISLNQAVDLITGPVDSDVSLTMERVKGTDDDGKDIVEEIVFPLKRAVIPLVTVKGWKRTGPREDQWDWFIDPQNRIGYVRLLQFTEETTKDLRAAITQMKAQVGGDMGINGLILDLRFNPGGLLTEAVSVANTFIDQGMIVSTEGTVPPEFKRALPDQAMLAGVPVAVLINEGSASASEIVSGAIRHYADKGDVDAILVGQRSFGKGSVQNVFPLAGNAKMKLTTQYYKLPDGRILHRKPGMSTWGVDPHLKVAMLPTQETDALKMRQDADVLPIDADGKIVESKTPRAEPEDLITKGVDLQLQTALFLLQSRASDKSDQARLTPAPTNPN